MKRGGKAAVETKATLYMILLENHQHYSIIYAIIFLVDQRLLVGMHGFAIVFVYYIFFPCLWKLCHRARLQAVVMDQQPTKIVF